MLKNGGNLLPLNLKKIKSIAVIGDNATHKHAHGGFGAGVKALYEITPLDGLKARIGNKATIHFVQGYMPKYTPRKGRGYGRDPINTPDSSLIKEATEAAKNSEVAIIFAGTNHDVETEARDRQNLTLPFGQDELIKAVSAVNKNTIVVIVAGAPIDLSTANAACPAMIWSWFNGSEGGNALADILLGNISPSGRLPFTIPVKLEDSPAHALNAFPGDSSVTYSEGILVGYRWFNTKNIKPLYGFGYGLSYTSFRYSGLTSDKKEYEITDTMLVTAKIKNTGNRTGLETVQLYVGKSDSKILRPAKELRAFKKMTIDAGNESIVKLLIPVKNLAYFDERQMNWVVEPGMYTLMVGSSSQDVKGEVKVKVK
jgi:beta-glucosidase